MTLTWRLQRMAAGEALARRIRERRRPRRALSARRAASSASRALLAAAVVAASALPHSVVASSLGDLSEGVPSWMCSQSLTTLVTSPEKWEQASMSSAGVGWSDCVADKATNSTPLHEVAARAAPGNAGKPGVTAAMVQKLVAGGGRLLARNAGNLTALHVAAGRGASSAIAGLCIAASAGGSDQLQALLDAQDTRQRTSLALAESAGQFAAARLLVAWGAGSRGSGGAGEGTGDEGICSGAMLNAVLQGDFAGVERAVLDGDRADCRVRDGKGRTLLHVAADVADHLEPSKSSDSVRTLLRFGARPLRSDHAGEPPVFAAVRGGSVPVLKLLLEAAPAKAIATADVHGRTALHIAGAVGSLACARVLLQRGAPVDVRDSLGLTPLDAASRGGHPRVADIIRIAQEDPLGHYRNIRQQVFGATGNTTVTLLPMQSSATWTEAPKEAPPVDGSRGAGGDDEVVDETASSGAGLGLQLISVTLGTVLGIALASWLCYTRRLPCCRRKESGKVVDIECAGGNGALVVASAADSGGAARKPALWGTLEKRTDEEAPAQKPLPLEDASADDGIVVPFTCSPSSLT
eukprot:TRINITY_DN13007_c0_g1_i1.p1 TRINITY_DN13007_c0_g1~~TRINITY_DN13007_c0_g1_i1.p1  ORF type:complete len:580 (+),score=107.31 TRINITY_DN13007_c0_g1_i1:115-1854(+)